MIPTRRDQDGSLEIGDPQSMILQNSVLGFFPAILVILVSRMFENHITEPPGHQDVEPGHQKNHQKTASNHDFEAKIVGI
jgi:hypothetical protein